MKKLLKMLKKVKLRSLLFLIFLLIFNTYAWFIFISKVNTSLSVSVGSWSIIFKSNDQVITNKVLINIDNALPGMDEFSNQITVINNGETGAYLTYNIQSMKIFGTTYTKDDGADALTSDEEEQIQKGYPLLEGTYTEEQLEQMLEYFPFDIKINIDDFKEVDEHEEGMYTITMNWPLDSGNDELDTYWGNKAYEFNNTKAEGEASVELNLILEAKQADE